MDESGTNEAEVRRKEVSGRRVAGAIRSLISAWGLQLECTRVLHETLLMFGSETLIWKEKNMFRIKVEQMDNLRGLLGIRRMDKVPNTR